MQSAFDKQRHIKHHSRTIRVLFRRLRLFEQAFNHGRMNNIIQKLHTTLLLGCISFRRSICRIARAGLILHFVVLFPEHTYRKLFSVYIARFIQYALAERISKLP